MNKKLPLWALAVSIILLLWSLAGLYAFYSQSTMSAGAMAQLPQAQRDIWAAMPKAIWWDYGLAVGAGFVGAVGLLMRKAWSVWPYLVSLVAVVIQFGYVFGAYPILSTVGVSSVAFPAFIIAVGAVAWWLSRNWAAKGWLT